jgi:hypothetical protein
MKNIIFIFAVATGLSSCVTPAPPGMPKSAYKPVLMDRTTLKSSITFQDPKVLNTPGKVYIKDNYIFISERFKGVHIYDNTDKTKPKDLGFIRVPGCLDMAVKNNTMYVDNSTDLVAINLSNPAQPQVMKRVENILPEPTPPDGLALDDAYSLAKRPANTVIVDWEIIKK